MIHSCRGVPKGGLGHHLVGPTFKKGFGFIQGWGCTPLFMRFWTGVVFAGCLKRVTHTSLTGPARRPPPGPALCHGDTKRQQGPAFPQKRPDAGTLPEPIPQALNQ